VSEQLISEQEERLAAAAGSRLRF